MVVNVCFSIHLIHIGFAMALVRIRALLLMYIGVSSGLAIVSAIVFSCVLRDFIAHYVGLSVGRSVRPSVCQSVV